MRLPWHPDPAETVDMSIPTSAVSEPHQLEPDPAWERPTFEPKPAELVKAAGITVNQPGGDLLWTASPPIAPGLYFWRHPGEDASNAKLSVVVAYGASMAVAIQHKDSTLYRSVGTLERNWAGPIPIPAGLDLKRWWGLR